MAMTFMVALQVREILYSTEAIMRLKARATLYQTNVKFTTRENSGNPGLTPVSKDEN
jgi:hypothetical protein